MGDFILCLVEVAAAHLYQLTIVPHLSFVDRDRVTFSKKDLLCLYLNIEMYLHLGCDISIFALRSRYLFICLTFSNRGEGASPGLVRYLKDATGFFVNEKK